MNARRPAGPAAGSHPGDGFADPDDAQLGQDLLESGWVQLAAEDRQGLDRIRRRAAELAAGHLNVAAPGEDPGPWLEALGERCGGPGINDLRLAVFRGLNAHDWLRPTVYRVARRALHALVGNELAMQRRVNLSIQMPGDGSSLLPLHADSWSGDSPYEIVLWIPLVDCRATQSMFLLPRPECERLLGPGVVAASGSVEAIFERVRDDVHFLDIPYGDLVLFDQNLPHGNRVNEEATTRWSLNCRFKGLFTPYADKKLGEFFEPITVRPMSRLGMAHRFPSGFDGD
ncbi:MAG: sporadic carbohydrate cluster 2OG-Fe(II) oxygenase [Acidobacteriota bacterium]